MFPLAFRRCCCSIVNPTIGGFRVGSGPVNRRLKNPSASATGATVFPVRLWNALPDALPPTPSVFSQESATLTSIGPGDGFSRRNTNAAAGNEEFLTSNGISGEKARIETLSGIDGSG